MSEQHWLGFWLEMMASRASSGTFCPSSMNSAHWSRRHISSGLAAEESDRASVLTEYRFGLFSFGASLYWTIALRCGSWSSICQHTVIQDRKWRPPARCSLTFSGRTTPRVQIHDLGKVKGHRGKVHPGTRIDPPCCTMCVGCVFRHTTNTNVSPDAACDML